MTAVDPRKDYAVLLNTGAVASSGGRVNLTVNRTRFLALAAAIAGTACGSGTSTDATGTTAGVPTGASQKDGGGADGSGASNATAPTDSGSSGPDAGGDADDGIAPQVDAQSSDAGTSWSDGSVGQDAAVDGGPCTNPCAGTCCAEGAVCVDDGRGNQACAQGCTDSAQCPSSAPCCGPAQEGLCGQIGIGATWACLPAGLCAGEYCRCTANSQCGPAQEGLSAACAPFIGSTGVPSVPVCNAPGARSTLYIHGRDSGPSPAPGAWDYWIKARPGVNATPVNWGGKDRIANTNAIVRAALDTYCTGNNWCYVACHSAGCAQIGYALALYGTTGGVDSWNIYWISAAGSAEGGSEIANAGRYLGIGLPLDEDLKTSVMRDPVFFNHDNTAGVTHYMFAGDGWADNPAYDFGSALLPGADDTAVAYHSAGGVNNTAYNAQASWCNASDTTCSGNVLSTGTASWLWALHTVQFLDAAGSYSHYISDSNEGICSQMFPFVATYAK